MPDSLLFRYRRWVGERFAPAAEPDETLFATTDDGWRLPIRRYRGSGASIALCHGLGSNHHAFEVDRERSLAPWLARAGFDVFVVGLRTSKGSSFQGETTRLPARAWRFGLDELVTYDAPALLATIASKTGAPPLWVGHSLGGCVGLLSCGRSAPRPRAFVGIGVPLEPSPALATWTHRARRLFDKIPQASLARLEAPLMGRVSLPPALSWISPPGIDAELVRRLHAHAVEDIPLQLLHDIATVDARAMAHALSSDVRKVFVTGEQDPWASPFATRVVLDRAGVKDGSIVVMGSRGGHRGGYAHVELIAGRHAPEEVFPAIASWSASA